MIGKAETKQGVYASVKSPAGYALFRGIRYGRAERFKAPVFPERFNGVRLAGSFGPVSPQPPFSPDDETGRPRKQMEGYPYPPEMSEDCLFLNVYTPAETPEDRLPVLFYIHGGGFQTWYGSCYEYCGDGFCGKGAVVVTINYRLGVFGFFAHKELREESGRGTSGNYGLMDQLLALQWVRENIARFGGDPDNVTIMGQSAGAMSVQMLCSNPLAEGWFRHAAMHSGAGLRSIMPDDDMESAEKSGEAFLRYCGAESVEDLRKMPWEELEEKSLVFGRENRMMFAPVVDGCFYKAHAETCVRKHLMHDVDYLMGSTIDEGYRPDTPVPLFAMMTPNMRAFAKLLIAEGYKAPYLYTFDRPQPGDDNAGTPHSCDNRYLFKSLAESHRPYDESDYRLADVMEDYWYSFAKTGDPNGEGRPGWTAFDKGFLQMHLTAGGCAMKDFDRDGSLSEREKAFTD